ncbi:hypothetical protein F5884DRAFT_768954 [Xylogone sp. PMI_703]|nr:hypothetical protein F5884DRAFT_768954 [Xylogone sp. PMI_703]
MDGYRIQPERPVSNGLGVWMRQMRQAQDQKPQDDNTLQKQRTVSTDSQLTAGSATSSSGMHRPSTTGSITSSNTESSLSSDIIIEHPQGEAKKHIPPKRRTRSCNGRKSKDFFLTGLAEKPHIYENVLLSPDGTEEEWIQDISRISPSDDGLAISLRRWSTGDDGWDSNALLEITNEARAALKSRSLSIKTIETLKDLLRAIISEESRSKTMDFHVILKSHFDKLLEDIIYAPRVRSGPTWSTFYQLVHEAETLQHKWLHRFKLKYTLIDDERMLSLQEDCGPLHDVALTCDIKGGRQQRWVITRPGCYPNIGFEHNSETCFKPGLWWLNMACAQRDRIVSTSREVVSKGQYNVITLPMLTGSEEDGPESGTRKFMRTGSMGDMHIGLMQKVGQTIRVLRGHTLKSSDAPIEGVRYDGLYIVRRYGQTRTEGTDISHLEITLERAPGQTPMEELRRIPLPSQRDDWRQYRRMLGEDIRSREGEIAFKQWKIVQDAEKRERKDWHKDNDFKEAMKDSAQEIICQ